MGRLFDAIQALIASDCYVVGLHASERLEERGIIEWQIIAGMADCELIAENADAIPNPTVEISVSLPDGTDAKVVWSYLKQSGVAKLVTVHYFDAD